MMGSRSPAVPIWKTEATGESAAAQAGGGARARLPGRRCVAADAIGPASAAQRSAPPCSSARGRPAGGRGGALHPAGRRLAVLSMMKVSAVPALRGAPWQRD